MMMRHLEAAASLQMSPALGQSPNTSLPRSTLLISACEIPNCRPPEKYSLDQHTAMSRIFHPIFYLLASAHPDSARVAQQARNFCMDLPDDRKKATIIHAGDTKFTEQFRAIRKSEGLRPQQVVFRSPNLNAFVERMVQTLKQECLDHFVVLGERHLNRIVSEFVRYDHNVRPHQSLENRPPGAEQAPEEAVSFNPGSVVCHEALGGLLKHYERRTA
jgi:hypothetical protein